MSFASQDFFLGGSKLIIAQHARSVQVRQLLQAGYGIRSRAGSGCWRLRRCWLWRIRLRLLIGNLILKIGNLVVLHGLSLLALSYLSAGIVAGSADGRRPQEGTAHPPPHGSSRHSSPHHRAPPYWILLNGFIT
jgi:hypothetical protein